MLIPVIKVIVSAQIPESAPLIPEEVTLKKLTVLFLIVYSCVCWSQQMSHRLNNQDIIDMVALGISDDVIITKIHSAAKPEDLAFDTSADGPIVTLVRAKAQDLSARMGYRTKMAG